MLAVSQVKCRDWCHHYAIGAHVAITVMVFLQNHLLQVITSIALLVEPAGPHFFIICWTLTTEVQWNHWVPSIICWTLTKRAFRNDGRHWPTKLQLKDLMWQMLQHDEQDFSGFYLHLFLCMGVGDKGVGEYFQLIDGKGIWIYSNYIELHPITVYCQLLFKLATGYLPTSIRRQGGAAPPAGAIAPPGGSNHTLSIASVHVLRSSTPPKKNRKHPPVSRTDSFLEFWWLKVLKRVSYNYTTLYHLGAWAFFQHLIDRFGMLLCQPLKKKQQKIPQKKTTIKIP